MVTVKDHQTEWLFDPWKFLGPKRRKLLENSWAGIFRKYLFEKLPVGVVARHFNDRMGRPSKELYTVIGALILQQLHDLSDMEVIRALAFNIDWHYALDITDESDDGAYLSERTLRRYRAILMDEHLDRQIFETLTDTLITEFGVDTSKQRLDSTIIRSNMRKLGRIRICATTIQKFLKKLRRTHKELFDSHLMTDFTDRYLARNADGLFSQVKPSETSRTLQNIGDDLVYLIEMFRPYESVRAWAEYRLLERVLHEQFHVTGRGPDTQITIKPPKDVSSDSLQNPSDPTAGYDAHKGSGYQAQLMETYHPEKHDMNSPDLITYVEVEPANKQDSNGLLPAIEAVSQHDWCPDDILCDTLYGSDDNVVGAEKKGVEVIAPVKGNAPLGSILLDDFTFDPSTNTVIRCPEGNEPVWSGPTIKNRLKAIFPSEICGLCPRLKACPVYSGKKASYLYYDETKLRLAIRRTAQQTPEFKDRYRWRAGIEATFSHLKTDVRAGRLRVRGLRSVRYTLTLKALALNILRCARALNLSIQPFFGRFSALNNRYCRLFILYLKTSLFNFNNMFNYAGFA